MPHPVPPAQPTPGPTPLLWRAARGETEAFSECVARYGGLVWAMARRMVPHEAEDAVQEVFVDLWRSAGRYDPRVASEVTFVAMIARRRIIDRRRRVARRSDVPTAEMAAIPSVAPGPDRGAEAAIAARAVEALPPDQRAVLVLATCQGLTHEEIAEATGMPLGTVKSHARRGLMRIRAALLGVEEPEDPS
jgi:RNA polymerase sigma factor (sigma-70 family)